ncbi:MAG: hypothetical protein GY805_32535 [Chloroflexi bacterium]|nr:hypothetical protein [Chloroflexota bacterium]
MNRQGAQKNNGPNPHPKSQQAGNNALLGLNLPQKSVVGIILVVALLAFELFNFDTTRYALSNLLGDVRFAGVGWATILAIAFCAIDFAGLARLFTPERGQDEPTAVHYLMGAWLLGATMNAIMTWWAISLTLLTHELGNEVLNREQLLRWVPFFVAMLVWLTRILFIGAISVAGEYMFEIPSLWKQDNQAKRPSAKRQTNRGTHGKRPFRPNAVPMRASSRQASSQRPPKSPKRTSQNSLQAPSRTHSGHRRL